MNLQEQIGRIKMIMGAIGVGIIAEATIPPTVLSLSMKYNPEVEQLQKELKAKGYDLGSYGKNKDGVDGKYGPFTKKAHQSFLSGVNPQKFNADNKQVVQQMQQTNVNDSSLKDYNFHMIPDGKGNYRSAQIPVSILGSVIDKYGIKNIIRFNGDGRDSKHMTSHPETSVADEKSLAQSKGVNFYRLSSTSKQDQVNSILSGGNTLIHCAHGADRTGGNVGGYLHTVHGWPTEKVWQYTTQYNGWKRMIKGTPGVFVNGGYLTQAQKFGVRDLEHAKSLN